MNRFHLALTGLFLSGCLSLCPDRCNAAPQITEIQQQIDQANKAGDARLETTRLQESVEQAWSALQAEDANKFAEGASLGLQSLRRLSVLATTHSDFDFLQKIAPLQAAWEHVEFSSKETVPSKDAIEQAFKETLKLQPEWIEVKQSVEVIAHRGASGYLPEHTEGAKVLAFAQGADIIEQDVVLSRDLVPVILHDIHLEATTDVRKKFPDRVGTDGHYYSADFDLSELKQLTVNERMRNESAYAFTDRFNGSLGQRIPTLEEEIRLVQGLNRVFRKRVGLHVELKGAEFHTRKLNVQMGDIVVAMLHKYGYRDRNDRCIIQCFEPAELKRLHATGSRLTRVQLHGGVPRDLDVAAFCKQVAQYADGIGPSLGALVLRETPIQSSGLVEAAHQEKLLVHPYTVRADQLPPFADSLEQLHKLLIEDLRVDGFFTDFPDLGRQAVDRSQQK